MEYTIENELLTLTVASHGAEMTDLRRKAAPGEPLLWDGDPAFWARHAPVLFPWCSRMEDNWFEFEGKKYENLPQHGFNRDMEHILVEQGKDTILFRLDWPGDEKLFPWKFSFETRHTLRGNVVETVCTGTNTGDKPMPAQLGFHAALRCPFTPGKDFSDYIVRFEKPEAPGKTDVFPLDAHTFDHDSTCFPDLQSQWLQVEEKGTGKYLRVKTEGFPYVLLWSALGCTQFVCIEPWSGFGGPGHDPAKRPGTVVLAPGESLSRSHILTVGI